MTSISSMLWVLLTIPSQVTIEESLEMVGIILFVFAMLDYIEKSFGDVRFRLFALKNTKD